VLLGAVELGLFGVLAAGPLDAAGLRSRLGLHERAARDLEQQSAEPMQFRGGVHVGDVVLVQVTEPNLCAVWQKYRQSSAILAIKSHL